MKAFSSHALPNGNSLPVVSMTLILCYFPVSDSGFIADLTGSKSQKLLLVVECFREEAFNSVLAFVSFIWEMEKKIASQYSYTPGEH